MAHSVRLRCLNLLVWLLLSATLWPSLRGQGEYLLFSPEKGRLFGAGRITLSLDGLTLTGQTLVLDTRELRIVLLGGVTLQRAGEPVLVFDEVAVAPFPFRYRWRRFGERIEEGGDPGLEFFETESDLHGLRAVDLYFECTAFTLTAGKKLVGERVVPHLMGVPSLPLKKLLLQRTDQEGRTLFFLEKIDYSRSHGLLTELGLNLALRAWQGSNRLRLFERELMGVEGKPRGLILQGQNSWQSGGRSLLTVQHQLDSDDRSFQLSFSHGGSWKPLRYNLTQTFTGRAGESTLAMLRADLEMTAWNRLRPRLEVGSDFLGGGRWQLSLPVEASRFLRFKLGLEQSRLVQPVRREDLRFFSSLGFSSSFLTLDSNLEIGRDRLELASRRSFALRCAFPTLRLMGGNVAVDLAPFYTFTSLPTGDGQSVDSTPGFNLKAQSMGVTGPLGLILRPSLDVYQVWDQGHEGRTSFTTLLALEKRLGPFGLALDYTLASRLSMSSFWVEGYHLNALTLRVDWTNPGHGAVTGRLFYNNRFILESVGIQGHLNLPFRSRLSGTLIYEALQHRLLSLDLFLERELMRVFRLRGGYSWALKRFFVDLMQSF